MSLFDEIGKKITNAGQETATKAKKFTEIAKLNSLIGDKEKEISILFVELGHSYYERKKNDESPEATVKKISTIYEEIEGYKKQIGEVKDIRISSDGAAKGKATYLYYNAVSGHVKKSCLCQLLLSCPTDCHRKGIRSRGKRF